MSIFNKKSDSQANDDKNDLRYIRRDIISITWPAFLELTLSTLFGMVDMMMVGQLNSAAITAVGLTNQPFMLLLAIFAAVNVGTTTLVAWSIGANNHGRASLVTKQTLIINAVLGTLLSIIGVAAARKIVIFMGAEEHVIENATGYFQIVAAGLVFQAINMGITAALRGAGETRLPMIYNIGSNLLNVFGNYVLIYGKLGFPQLGVAGAAISTTFSRLAGCLAGIYIIFAGKSVISLKIRESFRLNWELCKEIFSIGIPSALEQFVIQGGLMLFAKIVSDLGTDIFAAHQIGINISGLTFSPSQAFSVAATALVGQSLGAQDVDKAHRYSHAIHNMSIVVACIMGMVFILFSHPIARLYAPQEPEVAIMAGTVLKILAFAQPGQSTQLSLAGVLRGAGDTMYPLYASIFGIWIFRVIVAYIFVHVFHWGLIGAWVALLLDQYARATIVFLRHRSGKWKNVKISTNNVIEEAGM